MSRHVLTMSGNYVIGQGEACHVTRGLWYTTCHIPCVFCMVKIWLRALPTTGHASLVNATLSPLLRLAWRVPCHVSRITSAVLLWCALWGQGRASPCYAIAYPVT